MRMNIMTNNIFWIVDLSGIRSQADIFVKLSFINRILLIRILMEQNKPVVSGGNDSNYKKYQDQDIGFRAIRSPMQDNNW